MISRPRLEHVLATAPRLTIGLVGDLFLDRYLEVEPSEELSLETGLEAWQISSVRNSPGALGTVMNNLAALGVGKIVPITVVGDDGHGDDLLRSLAALPVDTTGILRDRERLTPTYTKPMRRLADGTHRELNRLDVRTRAPLRPETERKLAAALRAAWPRCEVWIALDQISADGEGVFTPSLHRALAELVREMPEKLLFVDSRAALGRFRCGSLKGNRSEILGAVGKSADDRGAVSAAIHELAARTGRPAFCTAGEEGIHVATADGRLVHSPGVPVSGPIDIVGAGDSVTSGLAISLAAGCDERDAADVANLIASITIQQLGTTGTASPEQVMACWENSQK